VKRIGHGVSHEALDLEMGHKASQSIALTFAHQCSCAGAETANSSGSYSSGLDRAS